MTPQSLTADEAIQWLRNEAVYYDRTIYKETVAQIEGVADLITRQAEEIERLRLAAEEALDNASVDMANDDSRKALRDALTATQANLDRLATHDPD